MSTAPQRKLAVIVHADVVGSTQLVRQNETVAHQRIADVFRRFSEAIAPYGGIAHEVRGDAVLAEFSRASDAVSAVMAFQQSNRDHNAELIGDIQPVLRVGVSLGEVIVADDTLTGPDVVLAQRLEQLAGPGGVCISVEVQHALPERLPFDYVDLGEQDIKGFEGQVRAYSVTLTAGQSMPDAEPGELPLDPRNVRRTYYWLLGSIVAMFLISVGLVGWLQSSKWGPQPAPTEQAGPELPDKPSIAVLPFDNLSDDASQQYFAEGMAEDIITDLSKISGLFVIARNSSFQYAGKSVDLKKVGRELGVKYVLEGSVRRIGNQVRINAQLIDATTGGHVWAERYDGALDDLFTLQDEVIASVISALAVTLTADDRVRTASRETGSVEAHDDFLKGWAHYIRTTPADYAKAIPHLERAVARDPDYSRAYATLAALHLSLKYKGWYQQLGMTPDEAEGRGLDYLEKAFENPGPIAHETRSLLLLDGRDYEGAVTEADEAIALEANNPAGLEAKARALLYASRPSDALPLVTRAMRLDPNFPVDVLYLLGQIQFSLKEYSQAATTLERAKRLAPDHPGVLSYLIATYGQLNRASDASPLIGKLKQLAEARIIPEYSSRLSVMDRTRFQFRDEADNEHYRDGLRLGGLPEFYDEWQFERDNRLDGDELRKVSFGRTQKGFHPKSKLEFTVTRTDDGQFAAQGLWNDTGTSRIVGSRLCDRWNKYQTETCAVVYRNPQGTEAEGNEFILIKRSGAFPFSVQE